MLLRCFLFILLLMPALLGETAANDYSKPESWLCRPGKTDACSIDQTSSVISASGTIKREEWTADPNAAIDCFYVYPTVSLDPTPNSDMVAGPEEKNVVKQQFARFGSQCRTYAPLYRQVTLTALRAAIAGKAVSADRALGYRDVLDAWNYYLEHDNKGRGVVLIGHSQGTAMLMQLIKEEIDGKPVQRRIVSAILLGGNVPVPKGKDVGGLFQHMPLCRKPSQTGCVITYVTFRSTAPPPANTRFGRVAGEGMVAGCTNPAALGGGSGELKAYFTASGRGSSSMAEPKPWVEGSTAIDTPFVTLPGLLTGECVSNEKGSYLEVTVHGDPSDPRSDDIPGDVLVEGKVQTNWGLHLIDVGVAIGNLVDIVKEQSKAYRAGSR